MRHQFDPFADMRDLFRSLDETKRLLEQADPFRAIREIQEQMQIYRPLLDSAAIRELALQPTIPRDLLSEVGQLASLNERIGRLLPDESSLARVSEATSLARGWLQQLDWNVRHSTELLGLREHLRKGVLHPLPTAVDELVRTVEGLQDFSLFQQSFAAQITEILSRVVTASTPEELQQTIESAEEELLARATRAPGSRLSLEAWLSILLTLIVFSLDQASNLQMKSEFQSKVQAVENRILSRLEELPWSDDEGSGRTWIVRTPLDVRAEPRVESDHLGMIYPGRSVIEIEALADWVRIRYFSDSLGGLSEGWAQREGLDLLKEAGEKESTENHVMDGLPKKDAAIEALLEMSQRAVSRRGGRTWTRDELHER